MRDIKITLIEERTEDTWFDLSLRQLRTGEVRFYRADDPYTGKWLFKTCNDLENDKTMVKAIKCPPGKLLSQLEGATMLFQKSPKNSEYYYDIISVTHADSEGRIKRDVLNTTEEVPTNIKQNFQITTYEEATGKKLPGKHLVTLTKKGNERDMITLFILERARTLPAEEIQTNYNLMTIIKQLEKTSIPEIYNAANEQYGIERKTVDNLISKLETLGKIERLDQNHLRIS